jgi:hypothetical protein
VNVHCPTCARPLLPEPMPSIGSVRFCSKPCVAEWFALGKHRDRRHQFRPYGAERRSS